jgi:hypothetical protein
VKSEMQKNAVKSEKGNVKCKSTILKNMLSSLGCRRFTFHVSPITAFDFRFTFHFSRFTALP